MNLDRINNPELRALEKRRNELREDEGRVANEVADILRDIMGDQYPKKYTDSRCSGASKKHNMYFPTLGYWHWECAKSPVGVCVYDHVLDGAHDHCVFCGGPEERK